MIKFLVCPAQRPLTYVLACLITIRVLYRSATDCREGGEKYKVRSFINCDQLLGRDGQGKQYDASDAKYNSG